MGPNWQTFVILLILGLLLFGGRGRIPALMGDLAKGIKSFRQGLNDDEAATKAGNEPGADAKPASVTHQPLDQAPSATSTKDGTPAKDSDR